MIYSAVDKSSVHAMFMPICGALRVESLDPPQGDLPGCRGLSIELGRLQELHRRSQVASGASSFARTEISQVHDRESLNRGQKTVVLRQHFMTGLIHESLRQCIDVYVFIVKVIGIDQVARHCAYGVNQRRGTIGIVVGPEAFFKVDFAEQHVDRMDPSEVQIKQVAKKGLAGGDFGPAESHCIRSSITAEPIFSVIVVLESANDIEQATLVGRYDVQLTGDWLLLA